MWLPTRTPRTADTEAPLESRTPKLTVDASASPFVAKSTSQYITALVPVYVSSPVFPYAMPSADMLFNGLALEASTIRTSGAILALVMFEMRQTAVAVESTRKAGVVTFTAYADTACTNTRARIASARMNSPL